MNEDFAKWDEAYSVGFPVIDDQHKKLVIMINDLFQLDKEKSIDTKAAFSKAFRDAGNYAQNHFNEEEVLLEKAGYPYLLEHKEEHITFINEVWNQFSFFNKGEISPVDLARFLKKWLLTHIAVVDKKYVPYLGKIDID